MKFGLIICTFQRPDALMNLLDSVKEQKLYPDQIVVVDGSPDDKTRNLVKKSEFSNLDYYQVNGEKRGLTKQRNFGLSKLTAEIEIVCFLDDDIILTENYFHNLIGCFKRYPDAIGIGGYILDEIYWRRKDEEASFDEFAYDGYVRKLGSRNLLRKRLGLLSDKPPGVMPDFSNGFSISFLPPSDKTYEVEYFMGGAAAYKRSIFDHLEFSRFFVGYGLYEDMDFCLRAAEFGKLYVDTSAGLYHYHETSGRPYFFKYGQMVIGNGWYVWRLKYPKPSFMARFKWNATALLLTLIRFGNAIKGKHKEEAFQDALGRITEWMKLLFSKPK